MHDETHFARFSLKINAMNSGKNGVVLFIKLKYDKSAILLGKLRDPVGQKT